MPSAAGLLELFDSKGGDSIYRTTKPPFCIMTGGNIDYLQSPPSAYTVNE